MARFAPHFVMENPDAPGTLQTHRSSGSPCLTRRITGMNVNTRTRRAASRTSSPHLAKAKP